MNKFKRITILVSLPALFFSLFFIGWMIIGGFNIGVYQIYSVVLAILFFGSATTDNVIWTRILFSWALIFWLYVIWQLVLIL